MSRSGLFRAAALLAAGATPLLAAGSADAAELQQLRTGVPEVGADKLIAGATEIVAPIAEAGGVRLPQIAEPSLASLPVPGAVQERSLPSPVTADLSGLPEVSTPAAHGGNTQLGSVRAPIPTEIPAEIPAEVPASTVISGVLADING